MNKLAIFLMFLSLSHNCMADKLDKKAIENEISIKAPSEFEQNIFAIQKKFMGLENRLSYLKLILTDKLKFHDFESEKEYSIKLTTAKNHLLMGTPLAAIQTLMPQKSHKVIQNLELNVLENKILFESYRMLEKFSQASNICLKMQNLELQSSNIFEPKWKMLCSYAFYKTAQINVTEEFQDNFTKWQMENSISENDPNILMAQIFNALTIRKLNKNGEKSINFLNWSINGATLENSNYKKAKLILALLYYENKNREKALSLVQNILLKNDAKYNTEETPNTENDEITKNLSSLTYARMLKEFGQENGANAWYEQLALNHKIVGENLSSKIKSQVFLEYARLLYKQKKYVKSEIILKKYKDLEENKHLNLNIFNIKVSRLILASILNQSIDKSNEAYEELAQMNHEASVDYKFLLNNSLKNENNFESLQLKLMPLGALAQDYGLESSEAQEVKAKFIQIQFIKNKLEKNKISLINALQSIDSLDSPQFNTRLNSCIEQVEKNFKDMKTIIIQLIHISENFENIQNPRQEWFQNTKLEILKQLNALDDKIYKYQNEKLSIQNIYHKNILVKLNDLNQLIKETKSKLAWIEYQSDVGLDFKLALNKKLKKSEYGFQNELFHYRKLILETNHFPSNYYGLNKKFDIFSTSIKNLSQLEQQWWVNKDRTNFEWQNIIKNNWKKLNFLNDENNNLLQLIVNKRNLDRQKILKQLNTLEINIKNQDKEMRTLKNDVLVVFRKNNSNLQEQLETRILEFQNQIQLSLADHHKVFYENNKLKINEEYQIRQARLKWLETQQNSLNWGVFR